LTLTTALVALTVTIAVTTLPFLQFAYFSPGAHVGFETAESLIALLIAYLAFGRLRQEAMVGDAALVAGFLILAFSYPLFAGIQNLLAPDDAERFSIWAPLLGRLIGAAVLAYAAFAPPHRRADVRRSTDAAILASVTGLAVVTVAAMVLLPHLPSTFEATLAAGEPSPGIEDHSLVFVLQVLSMAIWVAASIGFTHSAQRTGDVLLRWFGAGSALAAVARWNYVVFPTLSIDYVYIGDLTRLASYGMFLYGASRVIRSYWSGLAEAAVLRERSRLAHELHDGIAQELTFLSSQARRIMKKAPSDLETKRLAGAAERAAAETRRAIAALTRTDEQSIGDAVIEITEELCRRVGSRSRFDVDNSVDVDPHTREGLTRIVWEAVSNSLRHSQAGIVDVGVASTDHSILKITVVDEGVGFDPVVEEAAMEGFGLALMRERARAIGAELVITSTMKVGTRVELTIPMDGQGSART
jgi:signal transduction histidine kinase